MMNEIKITEENYDMYEEFNRLSNSPVSILPFASEKEATFFNILMPVGICSSIALSMAMLFLFKSTVLFFGGLIINIGACIFQTNKIIRKMNMKTFQKQYPNFDITIDVKEVEKTLEKYRLSKISKNIEEKKFEHLRNLPDNVKEMSTDEKLAYLEQEKEFWEQVAIQEKYQNIDKEQETQIKKVYHKRKEEM